MGFIVYSKRPRKVNIARCAYDKRSKTRRFFHLLVV